MELCDLPAYQIADLVKQKKASAREVLESTLNRIDMVEGRTGCLEPGEITTDDKKKVHSFITITREIAQKQANEVDAQITRGEDPGLLAGVPVSIKDIFCVKNTPSTAASRILANYTAPYTATPVERLFKAGTVMTGKANLDEFTYGSSSESSAFQPCPRNPWEPSRVAGGSSGGSTASVAAGESALSLGTDTAGSIRQPAAFCGVVGLKPTYGRVSRYGLIAFGSSLDCPGPVSRTVKDAALMLQVTAGSDPRDATSAAVPTGDYLAELEKGVKGMRIGLSPDYFRISYPDAESGEYRDQNLPDEIAESILRASEILRSLGAEIVQDVPMPNTRYGIPAYFVISRVEAASNLHRFDGVKYGYRTADPTPDLKTLYRKSRSQGFGPQPKLRILMGMYVSAAQYSQQYYNRALKVRAMIRRDFELAFNPNGPYRLDAMLTPTTPTTAFEIGAVYGDSVLMQFADQLTVAANHAGTPAISIPAGLDSKRLPIGIQFLGADFQEGKLLRIARAYEQATEGDPWRKEQPKVLG